MRSLILCRERLARIQHVLNKNAGALTICDFTRSNCTSSMLQFGRRHERMLWGFHLAREAWMSLAVARTHQGGKGVVAAGLCAG